MRKLLLVLLAAGTLPASALAHPGEPPVNDLRSAAKTIPLPFSEHVEVHNATFEAEDPRTCRPQLPSDGYIWDRDPTGGGVRNVWYRLQVDVAQEVVLEAEMRYARTIGVHQMEAGELRTVMCSHTGPGEVHRFGDLDHLVFEAVADQEYLIEVAARDDEYPVRFSAFTKPTRDLRIGGFGAWGSFYALGPVPGMIDTTFQISLNALEPYIGGWVRGSNLEIDACHMASGRCRTLGPFEVDTGNAAFGSLEHLYWTHGPCTGLYEFTARLTHGYGYDLNPANDTAVATFDFGLGGPVETC